MALYPTIKENLDILLKAGSFPSSLNDEGVTMPAISVMSDFKWARLEEVAFLTGVAGYVAEGARLLSAEQAIPEGFMNNYLEEAYSSAEAHFHNFLKQKRFEKICDSVLSETSLLPTLELLKLIVAIGEDIVDSSLPLNGVIVLGRFLRSDGDKIDFVKLEYWIQRLGIVQIASLQAAMLVEVFGFEKDEFPYIRNFYNNPQYHYNNLLNNALNHKISFSTVSRMNIAMIETLSARWVKFKDRMLNVEE